MTMLRTGLLLLGLVASSSAWAQNTPQQDPDAEVLRGRVLDPEGRPAVGASVFAAWPDVSGSAIRAANSVRVPVDAEGRFEIRWSVRTLVLADFEPSDAHWAAWKSSIMLAAHAEGYGPAWIRAGNIGHDRTAEFRLVPDQPITGKLVDSSGAGAGGVTIQITSISADPKEDIQPWMEALKNGRRLFQANVDFKLENISRNVIDQPTEIVSAPDGSFTIKNVGRNRIATLVLSGPNAQQQFLSMVSRETPPLPTNMTSDMAGEFVRGSGGETIVVRPSLPIVGIVRNEAGQALPGVRIASWQFADSAYHGRQQFTLNATTDASGRFQLHGMTAAAGNRILAMPEVEEPYFPRIMEVPFRVLDSRMEVEIVLHRGEWITGKVLDVRSGQPVPASLYYMPGRDNLWAIRLPEFDFETGSQDGGTWLESRYLTDRNGMFRVLGLPGRGIVGAVAHLTPPLYVRAYRMGAGAAEIADKKTFATPQAADPEKFSVLREVTLNPPEVAAPLELRADPGDWFQLRAMDPDGRAVTGCHVFMQSSVQGWQEHRDSAEIIVSALGPQETRAVAVIHRERKLGAVIQVSPGPKPGAEGDVLLQPCGSVRGRLLDSNGKPFTGMHLRAIPQLPNSPNFPVATTVTDQDGKFEFGLLPSGLNYQLSGMDTRLPKTRRAEVPIHISPGESKDLGDVRAER